MTNKPIIILGAGGHGEVVLDTCLSAGLKVAGFLSLPSQVNNTVQNIPVIGSDDLIKDPAFIAKHHFIVAVGDQQKRRELSLEILKHGGKLQTVIHPTAVISPFAQIGDGTLVCANATIQTSTKIGAYAIINTGAVVDHHTFVGDGTHICPNATLAGEVVCEEGVFVGTNATIIPNKRIGKNAIIGAGAVVITDVPENTTFVGNPAKLKNNIITITGKKSHA